MKIMNALTVLALDNELKHQKISIKVYIEVKKERKKKWRNFRVHKLLFDKRITSISNTWRKLFHIYKIMKILNYELAIWWFLSFESENMIKKVEVSYD